MAKQSFFRRSVVRIPFTGSSAATGFNMAGKIPQNENGQIFDDLTFMFVNQSPYDVRLEGTPQGVATMVQVTDSTGWPIAARSVMGPFTSKKPMRVSVQAFGTAGNPLPQGADFSNCFIEIVYGSGDS